MSDAPPQGHSTWRHKGTGKEAHFLTVAKGVGPGDDVDFAYFFTTNKSGVCVARVMRMDLWWEVMEWVSNFELEGSAHDNS